MYVKLLQGPNAGEVRDLSNEAAMGLLAQGRVARAFDDAPPKLRAEPRPLILEAEDAAARLRTRPGRKKGAR
jgi:hypothetical protein